MPRATELTSSGWRGEGQLRWRWRIGDIKDEMVDRLNRPGLFIISVFKYLTLPVGVRSSRPTIFDPAPLLDPQLV